MNLHSYSQANNREIGVIFSKSDPNDLKVIEDCYKEFESIKKQAERIAKILPKNAIKKQYPDKIDSFKSFIPEVSISENKIFINDKNITYSSTNIIEYDNNNFTYCWEKHLIDKFPQAEFHKSKGNFMAKNFPVANIDFSIDYGFVSFKLNFNDDILETIKTNEKKRLEKLFKNYRLYWSRIDQINIYPAKDITFQNITDEIKYCENAVVEILNELRKLKFENTVKFKW